MPTQTGIQNQNKTIPTPTKLQFSESCIPQTNNKKISQKPYTTSTPNNIIT
jgi:hypothetical protein